ncbi:LCP family protein [Brachybacterium sp. EF45031]|uniref:LCP family protein n=1 Tax=Brachybacterium sillae TaxID=2810536 RepID=UPI00217F09F0|nr:LCP family protein [Brachybacterium sillae]MCS6712252.1 LCP family protein [Brachybacterium sillae]
MPEHHSGRGRRRASGGRHAGPTPSSAPASQEAARAQRARAFGTESRPWIGSAGDRPAVGAPVDASATATPTDGASATDRTKDDSGATASTPRGRHRADVPVREGGAAERRARERAATADGVTRRRSTSEGGVGSVIGWTLASAVLPGSGLLTTRHRRLGAVLSGLVIAGVLSVVLWFVLGDPVRQALPWVTHRGVVNALMVGLFLLGLTWVAQVALTYAVRAGQAALAGAQRALALGVAALLVVGIALPFGRGVQSLWAAQALLGNQNVFGGTRDDRLDGPDPWAGTERLNVMLLGQDAGADRVGTRPDTIMVASIDTSTGRTALFSIPRNLEYVEFPEGTVAAEEFPEGFDAFGADASLINAVWTWAVDNPDLFPGDPNPGLTATTWAVEETLGLSVDYYAMVDLQGFSDLVDAIGGVDMEVERRIPIGGGTNQATGRKYPITGYIEPGQQKLDGYHALWYARSREGSNDFNRMCRQQRIVRVVTEEADPATLALAFPRLVSATADNIQTDIPPGRLDAFVELALRVKDAGFQSYPITPEVTYPGKPDYPYLERWVQASIEDSMRSTTAESVARGGSPSASPSAASPSASGSASSGPSQSASSSASATPTETPSASESEDASESASGSASTSPSASATPTIQKDPLKSCLPGPDMDPNPNPTVTGRE